MTGDAPARDWAKVPVGISDSARPPCPVHWLVHEQAQKHPETTAVDDLTYCALDAWARDIASTLADLGVASGAAAALQMVPGARQAAAVLGILHAGAHIVPLGPAEPDERCLDVLRETKATVLITAAGTGDDNLAVRWRAQGRAVLELPAEPPVEQNKARTPIGPGTPGDVGPDDTAYIVYTSGTTGRPKGIVHTHRNLAQFALWLSAEFGMGPGRRTAQWAFPHYDAALVEIFSTLVSGGTLCPVPDTMRFDAGALVEWLGLKQVNLLQTVPSFGRELVFAITTRNPAPDLHTLDHLLFAGEAFPEDLARDLARVLPAARLVNLYGTSEVILATWTDIQPGMTGPLPAGRPLPGRLVMVLDEHGRLCPAGVTGEIVVCSPYIARGYLGPTAPHESGFGTMTVSTSNANELPLPCYRTGDVGHWRDDGLLMFDGRRDRQVKLRGVRVEPAEIERALVAHPSVVDCVVTTADNKPGELAQDLVAYVVATPGQGKPEIWRNHLLSTLGPEIIPSYFVSLEHLPRNSGGKVDFAALPAPGLTRSPQSGRAARLQAFLSWTAGLGTPGRSDDRGANPGDKQVLADEGNHIATEPETNRGGTSC